MFSSRERAVTLLLHRFLLLMILLAPLAVWAAEGPGAFRRTEEREPCAVHDPLRRPHFGDTHVHTALSFDAVGQGTRNLPRDAYRFARGEPLGIQPYDVGGPAAAQHPAPAAARLRRGDGPLGAAGRDAHLPDAGLDRLRLIRLRGAAALAAAHLHDPERPHLRR